MPFLIAMTPTEYYQQQCQQGYITEDPEQLRALQYLERIHHELLHQVAQRKKLLAFLHRRHSIRGAYLWGGVGIGKTFLMDCFYQSLPFSKKLRMHFYQFMQRVHQELKYYQGEKDPLEKIAKKLAESAEVICFDELFVSDITDAMLLGRLFKYLFEHRVCLVATSNIAPDELYKNGLQREQFLPAIEWIKQSCDVVHLHTDVDYRLRHLKEAGVFYSPLDAAAASNMQKSFDALTQGLVVDSEPLLIHGREIPVKQKASGVVWFDFNTICTVPRSHMDYLEIAKQFQTVLISDIPVIPPEAKDMICLFIGLVDVLYDARVRTVISAAESVPELYSRGYMILEYTRTHSRLLEMQSVDYFTGEFNREK